jgi:hypothetical protein
MTLSGKTRAILKGKRNVSRSFLPRRDHQGGWSGTRFIEEWYWFLPPRQRHAAHACFLLLLRSAAPPDLWAISSNMLADGGWKWALVSRTLRLVRRDLNRC